MTIKYMYSCTHTRTHTHTHTHTHTLMHTHTHTHACIHTHTCTHTHTHTYTHYRINRLWASTSQILSCSNEMIWWAESSLTSAMSSFWPLSTQPFFTFTMSSGCGLLTSTYTWLVYAYTLILLIFIWREGIKWGISLIYPCAVPSSCPLPPP